jgi:hypothetical protein
VNQAPNAEGRFERGPGVPTGDVTRHERHAGTKMIVWIAAMTMPARSRESTA